MSWNISQHINIRMSISSRQPLIYNHLVNHETILSSEIAPRRSWPLLPLNSFLEWGNTTATRRRNMVEKIQIDSYKVKTRLVFISSFGRNRKEGWAFVHSKGIQQVYRICKPTTSSSMGHFNKHLRLIDQNRVNKNPLVCIFAYTTICLHFLSAEIIRCVWYKEDIIKRNW